MAYTEQSNVIITQQKEISGWLLISGCLSVVCLSVVVYQWLFVYSLLTTLKNILLSGEDPVHIILIK